MNLNFIHVFIKCMTGMHACQRCMALLPVQNGCAVSRTHPAPGTVWADSKYRRPFPQNRGLQRGFKTTTELRRTTNIISEMPEVRLRCFLLQKVLASCKPWQSLSKKDIDTHIG